MRIVSHEVDARALTMRGDRGVLSIAPVSPRTVRIRYTLEAELSRTAEPHRHGGPRRRATGPVPGRGAGGHLVLSTDALTIEIDRETAAFTYRDGGRDAADPGAGARRQAPRPGRRARVGVRRRDRGRAARQRRRRAHRRPGRPPGRRPARVPRQARVRVGRRRGALRARLARGGDVRPPRQAPVPLPAEHEGGRAGARLDARLRGVPRLHFADDLPRRRLRVVPVGRRRRGARLLLRRRARARRRSSPSCARSPATPRCCRGGRSATSSPRSATPARRSSSRSRASIGSASCRSTASCSTGSRGPGEWWGQKTLDPARFPDPDAHDPRAARAGCPADGLDLADHAAGRRRLARARRGRPPARQPGHLRRLQRGGARGLLATGRAGPVLPWHRRLVVRLHRALRGRLDRGAEARARGAPAHQHRGGQALPGPGAHQRLLAAPFGGHLRRPAGVRQRQAGPQPDPFRLPGPAALRDRDLVRRRERHAGRRSGARSRRASASARPGCRTGRPMSAASSSDGDPELWFWAATTTRGWPTSATGSSTCAGSSTPPGCRCSARTARTRHGRSGASASLASRSTTRWRRRSGSAIACCRTSTRWPAGPPTAPTPCCARSRSTSARTPASCGSRTSSCSARRSSSARSSRRCSTVPGPVRSSARRRPARSSCRPAPTGSTCGPIAVSRAAGRSRSRRRSSASRSSCVPARSCRWVRSDSTWTTRPTRPSSSTSTRAGTPRSRSTRTRATATAYEQGAFATIELTWDDAAGCLVIGERVGLVPGDAVRARGRRGRPWRAGRPAERVRCPPPDSDSATLASGWWCRHDLPGGDRVIPAGSGRPERGPPGVSAAIQGARRARSSTSPPRAVSP